MTGIYLVIFPDFSNINKGDMIGLLSGIFAAFAIITLSVAREYDSTVLIVFYLMAIGTVMQCHYDGTCICYARYHGTFPF